MLIQSKIIFNNLWCLILPKHLNTWSKRFVFKHANARLYHSIVCNWIALIKYISANCQTVIKQYALSTTNSVNHHRWKIILSLLITEEDGYPCNWLWSNERKAEASESTQRGQENDCKAVNFSNFLLLGYSRKNPHPPDGWGRFLTPPLTWISWSTRPPPPVWISKTKDPPSRLDFRKKNIRLKFNLFLI